MINKLRAKLLDKKGGFKEVLYDNLTVVIVVVLISATILVMGNKTKTLGESVVGNGTNPGKLQETINTVISNFGL